MAHHPTKRDKFALFRYATSSIFNNDYQGMGLGRALELHALQTMRVHGAQTVYVDHVSLNEAAINLSLQTGFQQIHKALRYFMDTEDYLNRS